MIDILIKYVSCQEVLVLFAVVGDLLFLAIDTIGSGSKCNGLGSVLY